jgi:riboflavin biosynthesis pyrimidine reductase
VPSQSSSIPLQVSIAGATLREIDEALERLRAIVADLDWSAFSPGMKVTMSAGVAMLNSNETSDTFLARADSALYWAKEYGKNQTRVYRPDVVEIAELKRQPGKDITIIGSGALVGSLLGGGLLDELRLMVHPVILGGGKRLFEERVDREVLKLVDSRMFATGVVYLTYRPADEG